MAATVPGPATAAAPVTATGALPAAAWTAATAVTETGLAAPPMPTGTAHLGPANVEIETATATVVRALIGASAAGS